MTHGKRLIEVAIRLDAITNISARRKSIRHGRPSTHPVGTERSIRWFPGPAPQFGSANPSEGPD